MGGACAEAILFYCMRLPSTAILTCTQSYMRDCNLVIMIVSGRSGRCSWRGPVLAGDGVDRVRCEVGRSRRCLEMSRYCYVIGWEVDLVR